MGKLSHLAYRLWVGMILEADDEGRLTCDTEHLRVVIFGYHPKVTTPTVEAALAGARGGRPGADLRVWRGALRGFSSWPDHQVINKPRPSQLPDYEPKYSYRTLPERYGNYRGKERNGKERKGTEGNGMERDTPLPAGTIPERDGRRDTPLTAASLTTPTPGHDFSIPQHPARPGACPTAATPWPYSTPPPGGRAEIRANPGVDLGREVLKAEAYLVAHPEKHYRKLSNFLHGWLGRADRET
mgnify:CR=1 FL=1